MDGKVSFKALFLEILRFEAEYKNIVVSTHPILLSKITE
jgi:hypothetical protein